MALVVGGNETNDVVCNSWEEIEDNSELLEKQLERLKLEKAQSEGVSLKQKTERKSVNSNGGPISLDSTTQDSLRTQYAPPEPKLKILARPKDNRNTQVKSQASTQITKTGAPKSLQQREQEYAAARMRILGDVRFEAEEAEAEMEAAMSPAEILKLKVAEAMGSAAAAAAAGNNKPRNKSKSPPGSVAKEPVTNGVHQSSQQSPGTTTEEGAPVPVENGKPSRRNKRSREKIKTSNPEPIRDFPVPKTDLDRIIRHPRGPDGSSGFTSYRS